MPSSKLANAHILLLGGSSGIGFAVASQVLASGARVVLASSRQANLDKAKAELAAQHPSLDAAAHIRTHAVDTSDPATLESELAALLAAATRDGADPLDHVVNTAGNTLQLGGLEDVTAGNILAAQPVRFMAPIFLGKLLLRSFDTPAPFVRKSPSSSITLTSGITARRPGKGWALPASVGGAIEGLSRALAVDLAPVRVNVVSPGPIMTDLFRRTLTPEALEERVELWRRGSLTGGLGDVEDAAEAYVYFMKDRFSCGQVLGTDGGRMLAE